MIGFLSAPKMHVPSAADYAADPNNPKYDIFPYWLVGTTPDTASANVEMGSLTMSISTAPKGSSSEPDTTTISSPSLTNMKALQPGAELMVFKAQKRPGHDEMPQPKARKIEPPSRGRGRGTRSSRSWGRRWRRPPSTTRRRRRS